MVMPLRTDEYSAFIEVIKAAREEAGMTQSELASQLGKPQSYISKNERQERRIDVVEFLKIAYMLGLDPTRLLVRVEIAIASRGDSEQRSR
jgi:transcriptional regulator with XRE-family HTH domain